MSVSPLIKLTFGSGVYLARCVCRIDFGEYLNPHVPFLRCVTPPKAWTCIDVASSLAKIEPINGLYATIAAPIVYALLGKTRRLAVLPEAALSLVVGEAIRRNIEENTGGDHPHLAKSSEMACMITFLAALITFFAGIFRLGFVDVIGSPVLSLYSPPLSSSPVCLDWSNVLGLIVAVD